MPDVREPADPVSPRSRLEDLEREREELWRWVHELERRSEAGLHARGLEHELRNDLTKIFANIQLAQMDPDPQAWRRALGTAFQNAKDMRDRLERFKSLVSRPDHEPSVTGFEEAIEVALDQIAYPLRKAAPDVSLRVDPEAKVRANRTWLMLALANTVLHVLRRLPEAEREPETNQVREQSGLDLEVSRQDDRVLVRVTGRPLPARGLDDAEWRKRTTGFEIPVTRRFVEAMGGTFEADPDGAWARFDLPQAATGRGESRTYEP